MKKKLETAGYKEIAREIHKTTPGVNLGTIEAIVKGTFDATAFLAGTGKAVKIIGFGTFSRKDREATTSKNPRTKAIVDVPAKSRLHLKPSPGVYA